MMKTIHLPLSYIIGFGILSQLAGIFAIKMWGRFTDQYSNKTIISIASPIYIICILGWSFVGMASSHWLTIFLIGLINILSGVSSSGINLAISNIGMKLAPKEEAIVYLSARNMIVAFVSALGPLLGGWLADFFSTRSFIWNMQWNGPKGTSVLHLLELQNWNFLFIIGGLLAIIALKTLRKVKEGGEVEKHQAVAVMRVVFRKRLKESVKKESILSVLLFPVTYPISLKNKVVNRIERRVVGLRKWNEAVAERKSA
jgi:MFS family permease